jgi:hypothetical protein
MLRVKLKNTQFSLIIFKIQTSTENEINMEP